MLEIRKADAGDAEALQELYLRHLTSRPPVDPQDPDRWRALLSRLSKDENYYILVGELGGRAVSSVTLIVVENLTHNLRPYALIENVVTHGDYRGHGYASALMAKAGEIAGERGCYKIMLMTGSKLESTLRFYERCGYNRDDKTGFVKWM